MLDTTAQEATGAATRTSATAGRLHSFLIQLVAQKVALVAGVFIVVAIACAVFAPILSPHDPRTQDAFNALQSPTVSHPLGTDQLGRDVLSRLFYGARVSLMVGIGAVAFGVVFGVPIGLVSGYRGGLLDDVLMRCMDAVVAFPGLILALGLVAALGPSVQNLVIAIGVANVPWIARIVRAEVLSIRERDYILAARAIGAGHARIVSLHMLPNTMAPVIVQSSLGMGYAVLAEAGLSFIGAGVPPPTPSWGSMLQSAFNFQSQAPMLSVVPGLAIFLLVLSFNLFGDGLRDILDPRMRGA